MIFLFHGDNLAASRQAFLALKGSYPPLAVTALSAEIPLEDFRRVCGTAVLFAETHLLTLEFFGGVTPALFPLLKKEEELRDCLLRNPSDCHLAFWFDDFLPKEGPLLAVFGEVRARIFPFRQVLRGSVFSFLESLADREKKAAFKKLFFRRRQGDHEFYLLRMIAWQLRQLLFSIYSPKLVSGAPWQKIKRKAQREKFSGEDLVRFYSDLYQLEAEAKSGKRDLSLGLFELVEKITG